MLESLFLLETPAQVFSSEICEIFKNNCFCRTLPVAASVKWNIEKSSTLNGEGPKRGTKRSNMKNTEIFHFRKTEKHCSKDVQSETKNKFCKTKCLKLNFYKCVHFLLFLLLSTFWIYYSYSFLLLHLSFHLDSVHHDPDFPHFSHFHQDSRPRF